MVTTRLGYCVPPKNSCRPLAQSRIDQFYREIDAIRQGKQEPENLAAKKFRAAMDSNDFAAMEVKAAEESRASIREALKGLSDALEKKPVMRKLQESREAELFANVQH